MKAQLRQMLEFHRAFLCHIENFPTIDIPETISKQRINLLEEEVKEVKKAIESKDMENLAKELCDLHYVLLGTVVSFGLTDAFEELFSEVHASNMSKLDENGKPILREDGKALKSNRYKEADILSILDKFQK